VNVDLAIAAVMATISGRAASAEEMRKGPSDRAMPSNSQTASVHTLARMAIVPTARRTRRHYGVG
jgi:hypothetical protein